jgi:hypothetical protein
MVYRCVCCMLQGRYGLCSCVFSPCYRCFRCKKHCICPKACEPDVELDDPTGPFGDLPGTQAASENTRA